MKNTIYIDSENQRLIMDRTFAKLAANARSEEYAILQRVRADYPNYVVTRREIKKNPCKESYRGLTYAYMERYIATHANAATIQKEYDELRLRAQCHSIRYPHIKEWFLNTYPEVAQFGISENTVAGTAAIQTVGVVKDAVA